MIIGIGTDIVDITRIRKVYERFSMAFVRKILAGSEIKDYQAASDKVRFLAKRFAAKEAAVKALGCGMRNGVWFTHFVVSHTPEGRPLLSLEGPAKTLATQYCIKSSHLSMSDERDKALAFVILEG